MLKVTVYAFKVFDRSANDYVFYPRMGTVEAIGFAGGEIILSTRKLVDPSELDVNGLCIEINVGPDGPNP